MVRGGHPWCRSAIVVRGRRRAAVMANLKAGVGDANLANLPFAFGQSFARTIALMISAI